MVPVNPHEYLEKACVEPQHCPLQASCVVLQVTKHWQSLHIFFQDLHFTLNGWPIACLKFFLPFGCLKTKSKTPVRVKEPFIICPQLSTAEPYHVQGPSLDQPNKIDRITMGL